MRCGAVDYFAMPDDCDAMGGSMPKEFEGDLQGAVFWGADLSGARFRDVNLTDVKISHAWMVNVDIDALVDTLVINGVDVTAYVNERDPWYPLRAMIRPTDPEGMRAARAALEHEWAIAVTRALALPEDTLHEAVNNEWSFIQTLRHLVFAMDKWFTVPILGGSFHPIGLPNTGSVGFPWPGLDYDLMPSVSEVLAVRAGRAMRFGDYLASVATTDFTRPIDVLENGPSPVKECIYTVFEEEFWHNRYAQRDLAQLEAANYRR
jgi:DinB superfamily/Pentapeptide repeats (8 copies)